MDDVDAFLASLEQFTAPSIEGGIHQANTNTTTNSAATASSSRTERAPTAQSGTTAAQQGNSTHATNGHRRKREREETSATATQPGDTSSLPFSSSRARAQHGQRQQQGPTRRDAQSGNEAVPSPLPSRWSCRLCTFLNEANSTRCDICAAVRPPPSSTASLTPTTAEAGARAVNAVSLPCPRCTFLNAPDRTTCSICDSRLPPPAPKSLLSSSPASPSRPAALGSNFMAAAAREGETKGSGSTSDNKADKVQENEEATEEIDDDEDDDDDDDDDDDESDLDSEVMDSSDSERGASGSGAGHCNSEETFRNRELVRFLQNLESVPFDKLPCAPVPPTMREKANLHPFQLQALHWLLSREQHQPLHSKGSATLVQTPQALNQSYASSSFSSSSSRDVVSSAVIDVDGMDSGGSEAQPAGVSAQDLSGVRGGLFADYMGLGKTRTLISLCEATRGPHFDRVTGSQIASPATLIVCPSSLMAQWASEIKNCVGLAPSQPPMPWSRPSGVSSSSGMPLSNSSSSSSSTAAPKVLIYHGSRKRRVTLFELAQQFDYVITSYQTLCYEKPVDVANSTPGKMFMIQWKRIILDEAHVIRNMRTVQSRTCLKLTSIYRWVVTATPIHNSVNDLYPLLRFLDVPYFSKLEWWNREIVGCFNRDLHSPRASTALRMLFAALMLRRVPDSVVNGEPILQMPPKLVTTRTLGLSKAESDFYRAVKDNAMSKLDEAQSRRSRFPNSTQLTTFSTAFTMLMRCRQACLHPYIVVAALRRVKLQLANAEGTAPQPASAAGVRSSLVPSPSSSSQTAASDSQARLTQTAAAKAAQEAAAASALQDAVNRYVDAVLLKKMRSSVRRGDSSFLHDLVNELKQQKLVERECIICLDTLCRPAILPCAHTFCFECIHQALHVMRRCPLCKQAAKPGDVLEVPEELIRPRSTTTDAIARAGGSSPSTASRPPPSSTNARTEASRVTLDAAMRAMNVSEQTLREPSQWPLVLSSKTEYLLNALTQVIPETEKVVVFSHFVVYLLYAREVLETHGITCELYTGALSMRQREKVLERFRGEAVPAVPASPSSTVPAPSGPRVLLATITTCGVGLNLTCANHCFLMEPTWNPGVEEQALNRVHRIGQTRAVEVTKLIARDTVEERVEALCQHKKSLSGVCFGGTWVGSGGGARIRTEDLLNLFKDPTPDATSTDEETSSDSSDSSDSDGDASDSSSSSDLSHDAPGDNVRQGRRRGQRRRRPPPRPRQPRQEQRDASAQGNNPAHRDQRHERRQHPARGDDVSHGPAAQHPIATPPPSLGVALAVSAGHAVAATLARLAGSPSRGGEPNHADPSHQNSPEQRVLDACQRGLAILNRTMRGG